MNSMLIRVDMGQTPGSEIIGGDTYVTYKPITKKVPALEIIKSLKNGTVVTFNIEHFGGIGLYAFITDGHYVYDSSNEILEFNILNGGPVIYILPDGKIGLIE